MTYSVWPFTHVMNYKDLMLYETFRTLLAADKSLIIQNNATDYVRLHIDARANCDLWNPAFELSNTASIQETDLLNRHH